ncbi:DUF3696 domain-containing protein [bacterium]|nr:DUF3696 domain-containing protein [bacterium]
MSDNTENLNPGLCGISITNFKGIGDKVEIPIRPITLLYGDISSGKSTIIQALQYARELFVNENADADRTYNGGDIVRLGGFRNLVHNKDLSQKVSVDLKFKVSDDGLPVPDDMLNRNIEYAVAAEDPDGVLEDGNLVVEQEKYIYKGLINEYIDYVSVGFESEFDKAQNKPWLSDFTIDINGINFISIIRDKIDALPRIKSVAKFHPIFLEAYDALKDKESDETARIKAEIDTELAEAAKSIADGFPKSLIDFKFTRKNLQGDEDEEVVFKKGEEIDSEKYLSLLIYALNNLSDIGEKLKGQISTETELEFFKDVIFAIVDQSSMYSERDNLINSELDLQDVLIPTTTKRFRINKITEELHDIESVFASTDYLESFPDVVEHIVLGSISLINDYLNDQRYIGPIRSIPEGNLAPGLDAPNESNWANGSEAYHSLIRKIKNENGYEQLDLINSWISEETKLNLKYNLDITIAKIIETESPLEISMFEYMENHMPTSVTSDDGEWNEYNWRVVDRYRDAPEQFMFSLKEYKYGYSLNINSVGAGIGQVLPIVIAILDKDKNTLCVEQIELHLHPANQCAIGDLVISQSKKGKSFILETHSEHLLLRLLKRVREEDSEFSITPDDLSVLYVEKEFKDPDQKQNPSVKITEIGVTKDGDFTDQWPKGFFGERAQELF